jgi:class 3 adenylate cyclase/pimeloyl-ACP methyl ester carboxylesterase
MHRPRVQFTRTRDGVTIAYGIGGQHGHPLLFLTGWVSHLETDVTQDAVGRFVEKLGGSGRRRVVRLDYRGTGLSDRDVGDMSAEKRALDLEAVVDALGVERVAIFAWAMSGPPVILYAAAHPEKVSHLILYGTLASAAVANPALGHALIDLIRADWNLASRTVVQYIHPGADPGTIEAGSAFLRAAASGETAARFLHEAYFEVDVRPCLARITMPTLVLHRRDDPAIPFAAGRELAALLPHGAFEPLAGNASQPFFGDAESILDAVDRFLSADEPATSEAPTAAGAGLLTILFTDIVGSTALTQRLGDAGAQDVLREHNAIVRDRLRDYGGTELKTTGDGFMASFPSASRALDCAVAIQQAFASYNEARGTDTIRVRIGLNAGEPVAEEQDLFGTAVQAAARIAARARPGQILVADVVRQLAAGKPFRFVRLGHFQLKGFHERSRLFELAWQTPERSRR